MADAPDLGLAFGDFTAFLLVSRIAMESLKTWVETRLNLAPSSGSTIFEKWHKKWHNLATFQTW
jgi:hypothetical protein